MAQHPGFRLAENAEAMKLCNRCNRLSAVVFDTDRKLPCIRHQPEFSALVASAAAGCGMCAMFYDGIVETFSQDCRCDTDEAYRRLKDRESSTGIECFVYSRHPPDYRIEYWMAPYSNWAPRDEVLDTVYLMKKFVKAYFILRNCRGSDNPGIELTELRDQPDWDMAMQWIQECDREHEQCQPGAHVSWQHEGEKNHPASGIIQKPTRLLDVGSKQPRLVVTDDEPTGPYVALSHCWGNLRPLITDSSTLGKHLDGIFSPMPQTFQDAITTTCRLGFRYLWIDSLCIIQDNDKDWERECAKMSDIYRGSAVTICGPKAADSSAGFLHPRTCPERAPHVWEYRLPGDSMPRRATLTLSTILMGTEYPDWVALTTSEQQSPLGSRAWILQEYLLANRVLFFGPYRMYWECRAGVRFEDKVQAKWSWKRVRCDMTHMHSAVCKLEITRLASEGATKAAIWHQIVTEYSSRRLTKLSDKLPAISGIAAWFLGGRQDDYLAGLLRPALLDGLAWKIYPYPPEERPQPSGYRAPSWSWASVDYIVDFTPQKPQPAERGNFWTDETWKTLQSYNVQILAASVKRQEGSPFGSVDSGMIKLKGLTKTGLVKRESIEDVKHVVFPHYDSPLALYDARFRESKKRRIGVFFPDDPGRWGAFEDGGQQGDQFLGKIKCICIGYFYGWVQGWVGLAVEPLHPSHIQFPKHLSVRSGLKKVYRRIGIVEFEKTMKTEDADFWWFRDSSREVVELY